VIPDGYQLLDFGDARRLERWGPYRLDRPDPTAQGPRQDPRAWAAADAVYEGEKGRGHWQTRRPLADVWPVAFDDLRLNVRLTPYKHTGVFPEQAENWRWMRDHAKRTATTPRLAGPLAGRGRDAAPSQNVAGARDERISVLNLFAYSGGATVALAKDDRFVTHVDASRPAIGWAKENATLNDVPAGGVRWMLEDAPAFVARELRRGRRYDGIVLDPPAFGHSPTGKTWRSETDLAPLLEGCFKLLSDRAGFLVLNGYARQETPERLGRLAEDIARQAIPSRRVRVKAEELFLTAADGRHLSTGVVARCVL
jgi:23S rRNA (cytosine1962-C5)-methyltransferase